MDEARDERVADRPPTTLVFETHSITEDNEHGRATGWLPGRLSASGRALAAELGDRRRRDGIAAVFISDLARSVETATIAFARVEISVFHDWRLRECDYGELNGLPATEVHRGGRLSRLDDPYPGGESWRQAVERVGRFLDDVPLRWRGGRLLVIGHVATRLAFDHLLAGHDLEALLAADFVWQPGWEYQLRRAPH